MPKSTAHHNIRRSWAATLPTLAVAKRNAVTFLAAEKAARSVDVTVLRMDGRVTLTRIGRRGGHRDLRTLGTVGAVGTA